MGKGSCGRCACTLAPDAISRSCVAGESAPPAYQRPAVFPEDDKDKYLARQPKYNAGPGSYLPTLRRKGADELVVEPMRWGLIPSYVKADTIQEAGKQGHMMINARSDNLLRVHKRLLDARRCVVVVDGFFEFKDDKGTKHPWFIRRKEGAGPLIMAGLWDRWTAPSGEAVQSCTVITTESNNTLSWLHDRLPCILERHEVPQWLEGDFSSRSVNSLLRPFKGELDFYEVGPVVNNVKNNVRECLLSLEEYRAHNLQKGIGRFLSPSSASQPSTISPQPTPSKRPLPIPPSPTTTPTIP
ncbi:hypothetical protein T484DRAFT_1875750, partial [Baffinella frigidus]